MKNILLFILCSCLLELPMFAQQNYQSQQTYLGTSAAGIGATSVWSTYGNRGQGVKICVIEMAAQTTHPDLQNVVVKSSNANVGNAPVGDIKHGTSCLGIVGATQNNVGITGIASSATIWFYSISGDCPYYNNLTNAINTVAGWLSPGDVISISLQIPKTGCLQSNEMVPVEWKSNVYTAIKNAVNSGIIVVEAAGNYNENLDNYTTNINNSGHLPFTNTSQNSGAIIVGGGNTNRERWLKGLWGINGGSNYGSRIDVQSLGTDVYTTDYSSTYRSDFDGTSAATPIVAGGIALLQSVFKANTGTVLTPLKVKTALINTGKPQTGNITKHIGPLPDIPAAIQYALTNYAPSGNNCTPPAVPSGLLPGYTTSPGAAITNQTPTFTWNPVSGASCYSLKIYQNGNVIHSASVQGTSYPLPASASLQIGGQYAWRLHAHTDNNCSGTCQSGYTPYRYIQISSNSGTNTGNNDDCSGATFIPINDCIHDDISGATPSGLSIPMCDTYTSTTALDKWYKFIANGSTAKITVDPDGNTTGSIAYLDAVIAVYGGCSGSFKGCRDAFGGGGVTTEFTIGGLVAGNTYYVRLFDYGTSQPSTGGYTICIDGSNSGGSSSSFDCSTITTYSLSCNSLTFSGSNSSGGNNVTTYGCAGWAEKGHEKAYKLNVVTAGDYEFTMDYGNIALDFFVLNSCDASDCLGYAENHKTLYLNTGTYFLVVDGNGVNDNGSFDFTIECLNNNGGGSGILDCSNPISLQCGMPYNGNTNNGNSNVSDYSNTCGGSWNESGPEIVHEIYVQNAGTLEAKLTNLNGQNLDVFILSSCDVENDCMDRGNNTAQATVNTGTHYIVVDGRNGDEGSYTLTVTCPTPALSGILDCNNAVSLTCGQSYNGNTSFSTNNVENYNGSGWLESGPEIVHTFSMPVDGYVSLSLSNMLSQDLDLFLLPNICDPSSCIVNGNTSINNYYLNAGDYYVVVDGYNGDAGSYSLNFNCQLNIVPTPPSLISPAHNSMQASNSITFEWGAVSNATMYEIQISTDPNFNSFFYANNGLTSTSMTLNNFANAGTTYYWRVQAVNSQGTWSGWSPTYSFVNGVVGGNVSFNMNLWDVTCNTWDGLMNENIVTKPNGNIILITARKYDPNGTGGDANEMSIMEVSPFGNIVKQKIITFDTNNNYQYNGSLYLKAIRTFDNGLFMCYELYSSNMVLYSFLTKLDSNYNVIWSYNTEDQISDVMEVDNNYLGISMSSISNNISYGVFSFILLNQTNGNIANTVNWYDSQINSRILMGNNELYWISKSAFTSSPNDLHILKTDINGNVIYGKNIITPNDTTASYSGGIVCVDGKLLVVSQTNQIDKYVIFKMDSFGNIEWSKEVYNIRFQSISNDLLTGNVLLNIMDCVPQGGGCGSSMTKVLRIDITNGNILKDIIFDVNIPWMPYIGNGYGNIILSVNEHTSQNGFGIKLIKANYIDEFDCMPIQGLTSQYNSANITTQAYFPTWINYSYTMYPYFVNHQSNNTTNTNFCTESYFSGNLHTETNAPIQSAFVESTGTSYANFATGIDGNYFLAPFQTGCNQTIKPIRNFDPVNGVSTLDAVLINQHLQGTAPLNSPYKIIAADVDKSGAVNSTDLYHINQLILGNSPTLPTGESWVFVDANYNFPNPSNPFPFPDNIQLYNISTDMTGLDFIGVKLGDVDNDAQAKLYPNSVEFVFPETSLFENQTLTIPVRVRDFKDRKGFQIGMWLNHNEVELVNIQPTGVLVGLNNNNFGTSHLEENQLLISWYAPNGLTVNVADTSIIFYLTLKGLRSIDDLSEVIAVSDNLLTSEVYTADLTRAPIEFVFENPKINIANGITNSQANSAFYLYPNPNNGNFILQSKSKANQNLKLSVYNTLGQEVYEQGLYINEEKYDIQLPTNAKGFYYIQITGNGTVLHTQKIMVE